MMHQKIAHEIESLAYFLLNISKQINFFRETNRDHRQQHFEGFLLISQLKVFIIKCLYFEFLFLTNNLDEQSFI